MFFNGLGIYKEKFECFGRVIDSFDRYINLIFDNERGVGLFLV